MSINAVERHWRWTTFDAPLVMAFLDEMERARGITARTRRNLRLTAMHSFFRFVAFEAPTLSAQIQRVLAIPAKKAHASAKLPFAFDCSCG